MRAGRTGAETRATADVRRPLHRHVVDDLVEVADLLHRLRPAKVRGERGRAPPALRELGSGDDEEVRVQAARGLEDADPQLRQAGSLLLQGDAARDPADHLPSVVLLKAEHRVADRDEEHRVAGAAHVVDGA